MFRFKIMSAPFFHDLKFFRDAFPRIQLPDSWAVPTFKSDDVIWNIVLAYLHSFPLSDETELTERVRCLIGIEEVPENFKTMIEMYNPFLDRDACFSDSKMCYLVKRFKERVKEYMDSDQELCQSPAKNFGYLEASSNLLYCNIVLISYPIQDKFLVNVFPVQKTSQNQRWYYPRHISLFSALKSSSSNGNRPGQFSFCIPNDIKIQKEREALSKILQCIEINQQRVLDLPGITKNFLMTLLKHDFDKEIDLIYKSPHVLSKLSDAGFETDPRVRDSKGKSAFFHALKTEKTDIMSHLYDHVANACSQTDIPVNSDDLLCLKEHLRQLEKDLESEEISEKSKCFLGDLCRFNDFQIDIREKIDKINIKYYDLTGKDYEAFQRKETVLKILKTYEIYTDHTNVSSDRSIRTDKILNHLKIFCKRRENFYKLDFTLAVMFYDHLFLLKETSKLSNNLYLDVETSFFLFVYKTKFFYQYEKIEYPDNPYRWIAFQDRLSFQRQLCSFKKILENTDFSESNFIDKLPKANCENANLSKFYGQFLMLTIQFYLDAATKLTVTDLKSILVIERCLQVLGESLRKTDFKSVQRFLILALPSNFIRNLKQIDNLFDHIKSHELSYRNNLEQKMELFIKIQKDLVKFKELFSPIYSIHKYGMDKFFWLNSEKILQKVDRKPILLSSGKKDCVPKARGRDWKARIRNKIRCLNYNRNILDENTFSVNKYLLKNTMLAISYVLQKLQNHISREAIKELDYQFSCIESILTFLARHQNLANYRKKLNSILNERKLLFKEPWKNACHFKNTRKQYNTVSWRTFSAENVTVGKQSLPEPEVQICAECSYSSNVPDGNYEIIKPTIENAHMDQKISAEILKEDILIPVFDLDISCETTDTEVAGNISSKSQNFPDALVNYGASISSTKSRAEIQSDHDLDISCETTDTEVAGNISSKSQNFPDAFVNYGASISSTKSRAEIQSDHDVCGEVLEQYFTGSMLQETIDTKTSEEVADIYKKVENPETVNRSEKFFPPSSEDWFRETICQVCSDDREEETFEEQTDIKRNKFQKLLDEYEEFTSTLSQKFQAVSDENFHFENIENYRLMLEGKPCLSTEDKNFILRSLSTKSEFESQYSEGCRPKKPKKLKTDSENESVGFAGSNHDYFNDLVMVMEGKEVDDSELETMCQNLKMADDAKKILFDSVRGQSREIPGNRFEFLRNRIKILKNILLKENIAFHQLWEGDITLRTKMALKKKIVQLYLIDSEFQVSLEMLLFDFMTVLGSKELKHVWKKTSSLFSGINLRRILFSDQPSLKSLGRLLEPYELVSELVEKLLTLISDECVLDCMKQILEQSGNDFSEFMLIMDDEENEQFKNLREEISECENWEQYAFLLPSA